VVSTHFGGNWHGFIERKQENVEEEAGEAFTQTTGG
jgi:hypothetical protein